MFTITFKFDSSKREYKKNFDQINAALDTLKLSKMSISESNGYFIQKILYDEGKESAIIYDYGFNMIKFECKQEENESLNVYQLGYKVFPKDKALLFLEFHRKWSKEHQDRVIRNMIHCSMKIAMFISLSTIRKKKKLNDGISELYDKYITFDLIKMLINKIYKKYIK